MVKKLLLLCLCLIVLAGVGAQVVADWWSSPVDDAAGTGSAGQVIYVSEGSSLASVSRELAAAGLLTWPRLWTLVARVKGLDGSIKRGEYRFDVGNSPAGLLLALVEGKVIRYSVTLPEGITLAQALGTLQAEEALASVLDGDRDPRLLALAQSRESAEGLFFPDTYSYTRGETDLAILTQARQRMELELESAWASRDPGLPYASSYELLVMASIVEKETGVPQERGEIAGVFVRRLEANMRLQTDPTVIYGLGSDFDGNLRRRHLEDSGNRFNTYRHKGLPPTPIALPGAAAIRAAVEPSPGSNLYFVARGDGSHEFSETLEQHTAAVRRYQLKRRSDYRSSPPPGDGT